MDKTDTSQYFGKRSVRVRDMLLRRRQDEGIFSSSKFNSDPIEWIASVHAANEDGQNYKMP